MGLAEVNHPFAAGARQHVLKWRGIQCLSFHEKDVGAGAFGDVSFAIDQKDFIDVVFLNQAVGKGAQIRIDVFDFRIFAHCFVGHGGHSLLVIFLCGVRVGYLVNVFVRRGCSKMQDVFDVPFGDVLQFDETVQFGRNVQIRRIYGDV